MAGNKINGVRALCVVAACVLGLAGCSGEPSEEEIVKLVKKGVDEGNAQAARMTRGLSSIMGGAPAMIDPNSMKTELHSVKKIGCSAAQGESGYVCDLELDITVPLAGRNKQVIKWRFVKGSDGWQMAQ